MKKLIVPIVLKRSILKNIAPANSFIAIHDFKSIYDLTQYLIYLSHNHTAYSQYFEWTKSYQSTEYLWQMPFCELCELLYQENKFTKSYENIAKWYASEGVCEIKVFNRIHEMFYMWSGIILKVIVLGIFILLILICCYVKFFNKR